MFARFRVHTRIFLQRVSRVLIGDHMGVVLNEAGRWSPLLKAAQVNLFMHYQTLVREGKKLPSISDTGFRVFSQFEEDGLLLYIFATLGTKSKIFVDIGAGDGIHSNCANLAVNFGWHGLFIDSSESNVGHGRAFYSKHPDTWLYPPKFTCAVVTRENVNQLVRDAGLAGEVDLLSIDIDGNDYWIWDALDFVQPRVVVIETNIRFGYQNIVVPYDPQHRHPGCHPDYFGASPVAMVHLARRKGYRLVGANRFGFNTIFLRDTEGLDLIPTVQVQDILCHPRNPERFALFDAIKDWPYVEGPG